MCYIYRDEILWNDNAKGIVIDTIGVSSDIFNICLLILHNFSNVFIVYQH